VSALFVALVSIVIFVIGSLLVEPWKWRKRNEIRRLEKTLETYGWLISVLKGSAAKGRRFPTHGTNPEPYVLEAKDILQLDEIFGVKAYLLSEKLKETWREVQEKDTGFVIESTRHRDTIPIPQTKSNWPVEMKQGAMQIDLSEMQRQAESDFTVLEQRYMYLTLPPRWFVRIRDFRGKVTP